MNALEAVAALLHFAFTASSEMSSGKSFFPSLFRSWATKEFFPLYRSLAAYCNTSALKAITMLLSILPQL